MDLRFRRASYFWPLGRQPNSTAIVTLAPRKKRRDESMAADREAALAYQAPDGRTRSTPCNIL
jgi:hypothetical protein